MVYWFSHLSVGPVGHHHCGKATMETYTCNCDNTLFFDNTQCLSCGSELGFCPACRRIVPLVLNKDGGYTCGNKRCGAALVKCFNYAQHGVCNRMVAAEGGPG